MPHITEKSANPYQNRVPLRNTTLIKGPWSESEDSTLLHLIKKFESTHPYKIGNVNKMFMYISDVMHRSISSCQRRYDELKKLGKV